MSYAICYEMFPTKTTITAQYLSPALSVLHVNKIGFWWAHAAVAENISKLRELVNSASSDEKEAVERAMNPSLAAIDPVM